MKKTKTKQLRLTRQTIAKLTQHELAGVRGGHQVYTDHCKVPTGYTGACVPTQASCLN